MRVLRYHPQLRHDGGTAPGMIALLRYLRTDEPTGLHRTYLRVDGSIAALPVLPSVECLTVHDEIDESGANAWTAGACAGQWMAAGAEVTVLEPIATRTRTTSPLVKKMLKEASASSNARSSIRPRRATMVTVATAWAGLRCGTAVQTAVHVITKGVLIALLTGIAMKLRWFGPSP